MRPQEARAPGPKSGRRGAIGIDAPRSRPGAARRLGEKAAAIFPFVAFPRLYASKLVVRIAAQLGLICLLVAGVFIAERFIHIVEMVVGQPVSILNIFALLAWTTPEIHLALSIAVLIAVHRVGLAAREHREFVVAAASGEGARLFVWVGLVVGLATLLLSLVISGLIYPKARFAFRSDAFFLSYEALAGGGRNGQFYSLPGYAIYVWPREQAGSPPAVFIRQGLDNDMVRIINADSARLERLGDSGFAGVRLQGVMATELPAEIAPGQQSNDARVRTMEADSFFQDIDPGRLMRLDPRGASASEWTSAELLGLTRPPASFTAGVSERNELGTRFARGLLCLLAPFMAWVTLAFTRRATQAFALPIACAAMMCLDIAAATIVKAAEPAGIAIVFILLAALAAALIAMLMRQLAARQPAIVRPSLA